jgi:hypothetical protein
MPINEELILQCFQQQADKISQMSAMLEKHEMQSTYLEFKQNMLTETILENAKKNAREIEELKQQHGEKIDNYDKQIEYLKKKVKKQNKRIEGQRQVLYQLLGGLFDHTTQRPILSDHLKDIGVILNCSLCQGECHCKNNHKWDIYPTTRQGDECETRIDAIEKTIVNIGRILLGRTTESEKVPTLEDATLDKDESPSSPLDSLSESSATSSGSSMSSINVKRMKNSYDLCGNE